MAALRRSPLDQSPAASESEKRISILRCFSTKKRWKRGDLSPRKERQSNHSVLPQAARSRRRSAQGKRGTDHRIPPFAKTAKDGAPGVQLRSEEAQTRHARSCADGR